MMFKNLMKAFTFLSVLVLAGCSSPSRISSMSVDDSRFQKIHKNSVFYKNLSLGEVTGGSETIPFFNSQVSNKDLRVALENSLSSAQYTSDPTPGKYILNANLAKLKQPVIGFTMTVHSTIDYTVLNSKTGESVFSKTIKSSSTKTLSDNFNGIQRIQIATEGAIKSNIEELLKALSDVETLN